MEHLRGDDYTICPRCYADLSGLDGACSNRKCSWPNPEPGIINALRLRRGADRTLQMLRERGLWPR